MLRMLHNNNTEAYFYLMVLLNKDSYFIDFNEIEQVFNLCFYVVMQF